MIEFSEFVSDYYRRFSDAIRELDEGALTGVLHVMDGVAERQGTLWVAGNGGSAAISDHTTCDTTKGTYVEGQPPVRCISLTSNVAMLTALGNDVAYDAVFSRQLEFYLQPQDAVLLVSSSGNSPNVVRACEYANGRGVPTLAFVGFGGGRLKELAGHSVWVPVHNYGIVEDLHQSLIHVVTQYLCARARARAEAAARA